jgi:predicted permease
VAEAQAVVVVAAAGCYTASCSLGALVAGGVVDSSGFRWAHHMLFGATALTALAGASSALWGRSRPGLALTPALLAWALLPRTGAPSRRHAGLALAAAPCYAMSLGLTLGRRRPRRRVRRI